jgi:hypothetical protein
MVEEVCKMSQRNVVSLPQFDKSKNVLSATDVQLVLNACRDQLITAVDLIWNEHRDQIEDDLLDLADRSPLIETRNLYYAAQSLLRNRNESLSTAIRLKFTQQFDKQVSGDQQTEKPDFSMGLDLTLMDEDVFEESLALSKASAKMQSGSVEELAALDQRIAALMHQSHIKSSINPLSPKLICDAFVEACNAIDATARMRLVLLQHFDTHLSPRMPDIYRGLNQYLVEKGVLPNIKIGATAPRERHQPSASMATNKGDSMVAAIPSANTGEDGTDVFALLQQLFMKQFANQSGSSVGMSQGFIGGVGGGVTLGGGMPSVSLQEQIAVLTSLQRGQYTGSVATAFDPALIQAGTANVLRDMRDAGLVQVDNQADSLTIDIVAMLFDYVFDDKNIPAELKALIGRLQIPVLKVALLDKQFFSKKSHPARRLLDAIAEVSVGWTQQGASNIALFDKVESIVQSVLNDFTDDAEIFERLLLNLQEFVSANEAEAQSAVAETTTIIETAERAQLAQAVVKAEIEQTLVVNEGLPEVVVEFVQTIWQQVLSHVYLQQPELGVAWYEALQTMQNLIWSVTPKLNNDDRLKLVAMLPTLLNQLRDGMSFLNIDNERRDAIFAGLVACHALAVKVGLQAKSEPVRDEEMVKAIEATQLDVPETLPEIAALDEVVVNMDAEFSSSADIDEEDEFTEQARCLKKGEWLSFDNADGTTRNARLSWVSGLRGMYLFTNKQGLDAMTIALPRLAARLRAGEAHLIKSNSLTERAVERLIGKLQGR